MTASGVFGALELEHIEAAVGVGGEDVDEAAAGGHLDTMQEQRRQIGDLDGGGVEGEEIAKLGFQFEAAARRLTVVVVLAFLRMDRKARLRTVGVALHRIAERNHDGSRR